MATDRMDVQRLIPASPAAVFRVLSDPRGHVAIDSAGMLLSAEGAPVRAVGDRFVVHMDREALNDYPLGKYDVTVVITAFEQDREIAWTIEGALRPQIGHVYGYTLEPAEDGATLVTSYYDWSGIDPVWRDAEIFPIIPESALRATLGILARTVTSGWEPPPAPERPVLDQVNLVTTDLAATVDFYRRLGVEVPDEPEPWHRHHRTGVMPGGLDLDIDSATFASRWDQGWPEGTAGVVIGFRLPDRDAVDRTYEDLTSAGHAGQQPPYDTFWGARYAIVTDPNGTAVGLMSPSDPTRRRPPPAPE